MQYFTSNRPAGPAPTTITTRVLEVWSPSPTTRAIRVARPPGFVFRASQAVRLVLQTVSGEAAHPMSIASSPARDHLDFAARLTPSEFKRAFSALAPGDTVQLMGPFGQFSLERGRPAVMLAGGIGITPFKSIAEAIVDEGFDAKALLVYANRSPEEVAFERELEELAAGGALEVLHTVSRTDPAHLAVAPNGRSPWRHRVGRVDADLLRRIGARMPGAVYYVAGPASFTRTVASELIAAGVPKEDVRAEVFRGYANEPDDDAASSDSPRRVGPPNWNVVYETQRASAMPWFNPQLDADLVIALAQHQIERGRFLDVGTGPGTQAIALAERGFEVTGTDISVAAVQQAAARARSASVNVAFVEDDVLASCLDTTFDFVLDRGCFHVIPQERQADYVTAMQARLRPGGLLFLKCFADDDPDLRRPTGFSPETIRALFGSAFEVLSIERTVFQGTLAVPPRTLFCVLQRREGASTE